MLNNQHIASEILNYLIQQPSAKATFQRIAEEVLDNPLDHAIEKISRVLDGLVLKGFVSMRYDRGGIKYYQVNKEVMGRQNRDLCVKDDALIEIEHEFKGGG